MENISRIILVLAIISFNAVFVFGQEKEITDDEFQVIREKAGTYLEEKAYRKTAIWEKFADSDMTNQLEISKSIYESVPPNRTHYIIEDEDGRTETIRIGAKVYVKKGNGKWKINKNNLRNTIMGSSNSVKKIERINKFLEQTTLDGRKVNVYQVTYTYYDKNQKVEEVHMTTYWISENGQYMKTVLIYKNFEGKYFSHDTSIYEYDPKIRIVAPIK